MAREQDRERVRAVERAAVTEASLMETAMFVALLIAWIVCGAHAWAMCLGDFQQFSCVSSAPVGLALYIAILGPMGLAMALLIADRPYRLMWKPWPKPRRTGERP